MHQYGRDSLLQQHIGSWRQFQQQLENKVRTLADFSGLQQTDKQSQHHSIQGKRQVRIVPDFHSQHTSSGQQQVWQQQSNASDEANSQQQHLRW